MNQIETIMLALVGGTVVTTICLWLRDTSVDAEAGIVRGPLAEPPTPDLLAFQCSGCRRIRCADGAWRPEMDVPLPVNCHVSHRLCDLCLAKEGANLDTLYPLPAAHDGKPVNTMRRGENGEQKLRPVFAGAEAFSNSITK
jgi:hypothetical protein